MTLNQMRYFVAICEYGSLSLAAKKLSVTQPTLSTTVTNLERQFNLSLFDRKNNMMILTKEGQFLYDRSKVILDSVNLLQKNLYDLSESNKIIRVGIPPMIASFLFHKLYNEYLEVNPEAKFEIIEEGSLAIRNKVASNSLNIGFAILNNVKEEFNKITILNTELVYVTSKNSPLANNEYVTIEDLKDEDLIITNEGYFQTDLVNSMFEEINSKPKIKIVSTQVSVILEFIKMNAGGSFLMRELVDHNDPQLAIIPFKDKIDIKIGMIWSKDYKPDDFINNFINFVKKYEYK